MNFALLLTILVAADEPSRGRDVYRTKCQSCHGPAGAGVADKAEQPLLGDKSIPQLAKAIQETMPEDRPGTLSAADADAVAAFIHAEFYSEIARARTAKARVELQRLTADQHRNVLADLAASFRGAGFVDEAKRGLNGSYYQGDKRRREDKKLDRLDGAVKFDLGEKTPDAKLAGNAFSVRWEGVLLPPETGEYELIVRSPNAYRLWVNELEFDRALIDGAVRSGTIPERRARIALLGGRAYGLALEWSKSGRGGEKLAAIDLRWRPPGGVEESIPARRLAVGNVPAQFVPTTAFPPDDRSMGWIRGTAVSAEWRQAAVAAALEAADWTMERIDRFAGTNAKDAQRPAKLKAFAATYVQRAFRRPLAPPERELYLEKHFREHANPEAAVRQTLLLALASPRFLYRDAAALDDGYGAAERLALALWDSLPDEALWKAAEQGKLKAFVPEGRNRPKNAPKTLAEARKLVAAELARHAERMLKDRRAQHKLRGFARHWLGVEEGRDLSKDPQKLPGFDAAAIAELRASLDAFLDGVLFDESSDYRQLLLAEAIPVGPKMAKLYGVPAPPAGQDFAPQKLAGPRAGAITHPYLLAAFSYSAESSPIHRGVFLARGLLGVSLRPPPEAIAPTPADALPGLTTRERVERQTKPAACQTCHQVINPLGFTLETFDAIGRHRTVEHGKPVSSRGSFVGKDGATVEFRDARALGQFLADSPEAQESFVEQLFHHLVQQPVRAYGPKRLDDLRKRFAANRYNVRKLAAEAAVAAALAKPPAAFASETRR